MSKLVYTKAITNGRLSTAKMGVGESVTGTVKGYEDGKYGKILVLDVNGREIRVSPSGNLKFKVTDGALEVGTFYTITRKEDDRTKNGYAVTQFDIQGSTQVTNNSNSNPSVKEKLEAIRANRAN